MHCGILGLVCFPPHSVAPVHIICHNLPSPHFINLLQFNLIVIISLDFSKAFDIIRQSTLLSKRAELDLPTPIYNWLVDFFSGHSYYTVFDGGVSRTRSITASMHTGSIIGPGFYTDTAALISDRSTRGQHIHQVRG